MSPSVSLGRVLFTVAGLAGLAPAQAARFVWWEGEAARRHNFDDDSFGSWLRNRDELSGGDWLDNGGERGADEVFAEWRIEVPASGSWDLWARKFWKHGPFRWRFDRGAWHECGRQIALADSVELHEHVCANWVHLGAVELQRGTRTFELRLLAARGEPATACFDCFVLAREPFTPRGKLQPGEKSGRAAPGWWAFEPDADPLEGEALLDLRGLNEARAGEDGFVTRGPDGTFRAGDGRPLRFWGVNCGPDLVNASPSQVAYLAARLAKVGVNLVRIHGPVHDGAADDLAAVDREYLRKLRAFVDALAAQGIYSALSFHFPLWVRMKPGYGVDGFDEIDNDHPFALLYFEPAVQEAWRAWARALLAEGDAPLAREPAVAIVELINEDSFLFWTFSEKNLPASSWARLEGLYTAWLIERYGSLADAFAAWPGVRHDHDRDDHAGLFDAWHMTAAGTEAGGPDKAKRMFYQVYFLVERQRAFYADAARWLREDLGYGGLVSASNWKTTDPEHLDALERWTYTAGDVVDRHDYFGGVHEGPRAAYAVDAGDRFADRAAVREPAAAPVASIQYQGLPSIVSEIGWPNPNRWRADAPLLCSAYGALQGVDGWCFFAVNAPGWAGGLPKFPVSVPSVLGQFPAAALAYRRGDVAESETVIHERLAFAKLLALEGARVDPLACLAGKVERSFGVDATRWERADLGDFVGGDVVRSVTGELVCDRARGVVTVDTARSQAATGFLGAAGAIELGDVRIECRNEYATIWVISLDGASIADSRKLLIQAFTEERPFGMRVEGERIADLGGPPLNVRAIEAEVTLPGAIRRATVLDANGRARGPAGHEGRRIVLPKDALYVVVE